jgi:uncharacterized damage-inducible protein DinB
MKTTVVDLARYNVWANERLVNFLSVSPDALVSQEVVSSFPSIRATLLHISDAETAWLMRLQKLPLDAPPSLKFVGNNEEVFQNVLTTSKKLANLIESQPAPFYKERISFKTWTRGEMKLTAIDMAHHVFNHSTFHRGQIVTMCRQLGLTNIPSTDYSLYRYENKL